ncbi:MAG: hypothetical protein KDA77_07580 [Planctomycetaceae bacterium]|nr:hypothetical protein [Planctomycetaceae bacterium]
MNQVDWQFVATLLCIAAAVSFLTRRVLRFFKQRPGCGSCTGCATGGVQTHQFVSLDQLKSSK